jgi:hypothetical protein
LASKTIGSLKEKKKMIGVEKIGKELKKRQPKAKELKLAELRQAIQLADKNVCEKKRKAVAEKETEPKIAKINGASKKEHQQKQQSSGGETPQSQQPQIDPAIQAVLQNASKAALDGIQVILQERSI